jgi:hypothetical protein
MKIELKKISFSEALSEETNAFTADLYINGVKAGYCKNTGQGGCTDYHAYDIKGRKLIEEAEAYCVELPIEKMVLGDRTLEIKQSLESVIDKQLEDYLKAKDKVKMDKRLQKDMLKGLCVKTQNGYELCFWTGHTIESLLRHPKGVETIVAKLKSLNGKTILNTNLTPEILAAV